MDKISLKTMSRQINQVKDKISTKRHTTKIGTSIIGGEPKPKALRAMGRKLPRKLRPRIKRTGVKSIPPKVKLQIPRVSLRAGSASFLR
jgi:hypothetical protein